MSLSGLGFVNCEITTLCNKSCWMCARQSVLKPTIYGDIDFDLLKNIAKQLPGNILVQFHGNGEPLLYPRLVEAMELFSSQIRSITTNGKLLVAKANEIIDHLETLSISVFEGDTEAEEQLEMIKEFLDIKGLRKPFTNIKLLGNIQWSIYWNLGVPVIHRQIHTKDSSYSHYRKSAVVPEVGICWDFLSHPCIHRNGDVAICVRYDPINLGVLGNLNHETLNEIWNGEQRMEWLEFHKQGRRNKIPLCSRCDYWGIPTV